jgi:choice-of-anchor B domain-containing protein
VSRIYPLRAALAAGVALLLAGADGTRSCGHAAPPALPPPSGGAAVFSGPVPCQGGSVDVAGISFACQDVDLLSWHTLVGTPTLANDLWGWTDPQTGREVAIVGLHDGTAFVDLGDPLQPVLLGILPSAAGTSFWADVKVYADHAYIVKDFAGDHGMQVFDLTELRHVQAPPEALTATAHYTLFGNAHNIAIDEASGFAYVVGSTSTNDPAFQPCGGGLHMIDLAVPEQPRFAGCFSGDGYTHDTQCIVYDGPDPDHAGAEVCFDANPGEGTVTVVDVSDKAHPALLGRVAYPGEAYAHQGWLTDDRAYFLFGDEDDELQAGHGTRTYVFDVRDLDAPTLVGHVTSPLPATDHNLYVRGPYVFQANYAAGLRILRIGDLGHLDLTEVAFFDSYPAHDLPGTNFGPWSVYPYFASGIVVTSDILLGLFVLQPHLDAPAVFAPPRPAAP